MNKEDFDKYLKVLNITRKEFANLTGMKYTTVTKWNNEDRPVPPWVKSWLDNYIEKKKHEKLKQVLKDTGVCSENA